MEIEILKNENGYAKINIKKTDPHTLFNVLRDELMQDPKVDFSGYWRNESFYESIIFQVRMKDESADPIQAINSALERIKEHASEFMDLCKIKLA